MCLYNMKCCMKFHTKSVRIWNSFTFTVRTQVTVYSESIPGISLVGLYLCIDWFAPADPENEDFALAGRS